MPLRRLVSQLGWLKHKEAYKDVIYQTSELLFTINDVLVGFERLHPGIFYLDSDFSLIGLAGSDRNFWE